MAIKYRVSYLVEIIGHEGITVGVAAFLMHL